ncbi:hypothetical protein DVH24_034674 [Malus domestica]|uniref:Plant heme peroxidase family profile domain-containing protein n=1 Tax=Malus domestica TaxID=3750 RepID=A0A498J091_MALDO|nr:hypothetical protein DVH24_034674 [Malus domestica]
MADHPHCLKRSAPRLELFQLEKEMHGCSWVVVGVGVVPNKTLKGFDKIGQTKEALESVCTKCVSCADIHVVATGDGIVLVGQYLAKQLLRATSKLQLVGGTAVLCNCEEIIFSRQIRDRQREDVLYMQKSSSPLPLPLVALVIML